MSRMIVRLALTALAVLCLATAAPTAEVMAQGKVKLEKARLVGSWGLVSISNTGADGKATQT